jgi:zinc transporter 1
MHPPTLTFLPLSSLLSPVCFFATTPTLATPSITVSHKQTGFSITLESIERFADIEDIERPELLLGVGLGGLAINVFGMCLFSGHGHSHAGGGHGHGHGGGGKKEIVDVDSNDTSPALDAHSSSGSARAIELETAVAMGSMNPIPTLAKGKEAGSMNMHGVFLHLLGDFLGSVAVVITAVVVIVSDWKGRHYLDPVLSLVIVIIIVVATVPLVKQSALVLMQTTPASVDLVGLRKGVGKINGVLGMHELHVWSLVGDKLIASAHVTFKDAQSYVKAAARIKEFFHVNGIHSITIQPEFLGKNADGFGTSDCLLPCGDDSCETDACCPEDNEDKLSTLRARRSFQMPASVRHGRTSRSPSPATSAGGRAVRCLICASCCFARVHATGLHKLLGWA